MASGSEMTCGVGAHGGAVRAGGLRVRPQRAVALLIWGREGGQRGGEKRRDGGQSGPGRYKAAKDPA